MCEAERDVLAEFLVLPSTSGDSTESHKCQWTHQNTLLFLELYKKYRDQVVTLKIKNLKRMFEEIAKEMQQISKQAITGTHCENKWKVLKRNYKKYIDNSKLTGRGRKTFEYADIMHSILGEKRNIHPVLLLSSDTVSTPLKENIEAKENIEVSSHIQPNVQEAEVTPIKKGKAVIKPPGNTNKILKCNIFREIRNDRQEYYKKRLEIEEKKIAIKEKKNELLEKHNNLLESYLDIFIPRMHVE